MCTRIWVCTTKNGLKENSKHTSRNTLSLFWAQNKDLGAASQTLLTEVKLRQQCTRLTKKCYLNLMWMKWISFYTSSDKTWSSLPRPGICMYQCMVLYKRCFHSNNRFLDHFDRVSCPGQIMYVQIRLSKWSYRMQGTAFQNRLTPPSTCTFAVVFRYTSQFHEKLFSCIIHPNVE